MSYMAGHEPVKDMGENVDSYKLLMTTKYNVGLYMITYLWEAVFRLRLSHTEEITIAKLCIWNNMC